jgi:signal transduction histidine kinase
MSSAVDRTESEATRTRIEADVGKELDDGERGPLIAMVLARSIVIAVVCGYCLIALTYLLAASEPPDRLLVAGTYLVALLGLQLGYFSRPGARMRAPYTYLLLAAQACLVYLPILQFDYSWIGLPSLLAGSVLLVLPPVAGWVAFGAVVASTSAIELALTGSSLDAIFLAVGTVVFGLEVYGLTRLAGLIDELDAARSELANTAVAHERLRFARDLHDLLGLRLSEIAPKGELARRLITKDPDRARQELSEILETARQALADVRSVAHGYRELNLDEASRAAGSVLQAASVDVRMRFKPGELPVRLRSLLASVLREGATNVLKHSDAARCEITLRQSGDRVVLDMVNDGVDDPEAAAEPYDGEGGISLLAERVAALDGSLTAGLDPDGRFHLRLSVPMSRRESPDRHSEPKPISAGPTRRALAQAAVVFCGVVTLATLRLTLFTTDVEHIMVSAGYMLLLLMIQVLYFLSPGTRLRSPVSYAILGIQAVLVFLPLLQFGVAWVALPGFLAGTLLLVLRPLPAWIAFGLVLGVVGTAQAAQGGIPLEIAFNVLGAAISGLVVYGLTWMVRSVAELRAARRQLAEAAVADERTRFARDLHDLLGLSLSAITLKSELAYRLVAANPTRAEAELTEILAISRLALADVRSVAGGHRELSLQDETRSAESLLVAAEVDVRMNLRYSELPVQVGTVLATVLREGVTNVLRHSKGEYCEISVLRSDGAVLLEIVNDGVTEEPEPSRTGSGLGNLAARVGMIGGELSAGTSSDGCFRLAATVPL